MRYSFQLVLIHVLTIVVTGLPIKLGGNHGEVHSHQATVISALGSLVRKEHKQAGNTLLVEVEHSEEELERSEVDLKLESLLRNESFLTIAQVCSELTINTSGCERVKTYLGKKIASLTAPMYVKHKIHGHFYDQPESAGVTTKYGLEHTTYLYADMLGKFAQRFQDIPKQVAQDRPFVMAADDFAYTRSFKYPTLVRPAPIPDLSGNYVIMREFRYRVEDPIFQVPSMDVEFDNKFDRLVWRGSTRARPCIGDHPRLKLIKQFIDGGDQRLDIGFSGANLTGVPHKWLRPSLTMQEQLRYKFIMVLEGRDIASDLEWSMASNSVPFMLAPTVQTWTLQSRLKPWVHYVPVSNDFSDLIHNLDWAIAHPAEVKKMADAGKTYMQEFKDHEREHRMGAAVLVAYFNRIRITDDPKSDESIVESVAKMAAC